MAQAAADPADVLEAPDLLIDEEGVEDLNEAKEVIPYDFEISRTARITTWRAL